MTDLTHLRASLTTGEHAFADTLAFVAEHYDYQQTAFDNGGVASAAGQNEGSCKTLGLALLEGLSDEEALLAFGEHYRSVVATPEGTDHGNIRALIAHGLAGVAGDEARKNTLTPRSATTPTARDSSRPCA